MLPAVTSAACILAFNMTFWRFSLETPVKPIVVILYLDHFPTLALQ